MIAQHYHLICLDIETIPDTDALPPGFDPTQFPKLPYHKVVAISMVEAAIERSASDRHEWFRVTDVRSGGEADWDEARLLKGFWSYFAKRRPRVITWNGRGFDIPVLKLRAFVHGLSADLWHTAGDGRFSTYGYRYASDWHCDLMEVMGDFGASRSLGLEDVAKAMGLPGKVGGHGSEVAEMFRDGHVDQIRAYCEGDVLNLFGLYVRWALLAGKTGPDGHNSSYQSLVDYISAHRAGRPHLGEFLDKWQASTRPMPMLVPVPGLPGTVDRLHLDSAQVLGDDRPHVPSEHVV